MSADLIERLIESGTPAALVAEVAMALAAAQAKADAQVEAALAPSAGALRTRRWRERHAASQGVTCDASDEGVTPDVTPDPSPNKSPPNPQKLTPTPRTGGKARTHEASRLANDWQPIPFSPGTVAQGIIAHRGEDWERRAIESFRNHWHAANGPNARKRDWQAAWANWVIEQDRRDGTGGRARSGGGRGGQRGFRDELLERYVGGGDPGLG